MTLWWILSSAIVVEVMCHVPFLAWSQLARLRAQYASAGGDWWQHADWRRKMAYRVAVARIAGAGLAVQALAASWLVMAGVFSGFFAWCHAAAEGLAR